MSVQTLLADLTTFPHKHTQFDLPDLLIGSEALAADMIVRSQRNGLPVNSVLKTCTIWHLETRLPEASTASRFTFTRDLPAGVRS